MFSIVMSYYKKGEIVKRSIQSVLDQSFREFELLIVDDGSNDDLENIVSSFNDERIVVFKKNNGGVSSARNYGITKANYKWICFLDADDSWKDNHLMVMKNLISKYPQERIFCTSHQRIGNKLFSSNANLPNNYPIDFCVGDLIGFVLSHGEVIHTNSFCVFSGLFKDVGMFNEKASIGEDTDMWFRLSMVGNVVISKEETSYYHRDSSDLTKTNRHNYEWPFLTQDPFASNPCVTIERAISIKKIQIKTLLSNCKHYISEGKKREARNLFMTISKDDRRMFRKSSLQVCLLIFLPLFISKSIAKKVYLKNNEKY